MFCLNITDCLPPRQFFQEFSSSSTDYRTSSSETYSYSTPTFTPYPSSFTTTYFTPTTTAQTSTLFSTDFTTSSPSLSISTTTLRLPTSLEPPSSSTPPTSLSSGLVLTTFTSTFLTEINGSPTTIVTPIVTAVRTSASSLSSSRTPIIAGSVVAGSALLIMALATLFCLRKRRRSRQRYWALSRPKRLSSRPTLAGEEMDLPFPSPPFASMDQPDPFTTHASSQRNSSAAGNVGNDGDEGGGGSAGAPVYNRYSFSRSQSPSHSRAQVSFSTPPPPLPPPTSSLTPPRLLRARASESGSIFQESVWPPPSAASQLMDPLTFPSQSVDLARVVTDVMGPPESGPLLLLQPNSSSGHGQEQEQGALNLRGEGERRGSSTPDNWSPRSELESPSSPSPPSSPPRPLLRLRPESESDSDISLRPPSTPWLSRPLNPSPRGSPSPLQRALPL